MTEAVVIMAIGPVQGFIAAARRSRDLWYGSWLLSELSKAAAQAVAARVGVGALIFPATDNEKDLQPDSSLNVANKVVALVPAAQAAEIAEAARAAVATRVKQLAEEAFGHVKGRFDRDIALKQVADLPEVVWATAEVAADGYAAARDRAERALAARKSLRDFAPVGEWGSVRPKSSLDGLRESVLPEPKGEDAAKRYEKYGVRGGEQLCGVGLMKRHGQRGRGDQADRVCSTSHVAALPTLEQIPDNEDARRAASEFFRVLREELGLPAEVFGKTPFPHPVFGDRDGRLLFESRYGEFFEDEPDRAERRRKQETAVRALKRFLREAGVKAPYPYYGLLLADGDRMGAAIDDCKTPEAHRKLSRALADFAGNTRRIVEDDHRGSLIYAGGDDVLAYVPLHTALACAKALADAFRQKLGGFQTADGQAPTLSVGLAVSHHLDPLEDAILRARRAEGRAKQTRNALAIAFDKRGGVETVVGGEWGKFDARFDQLIALYAAGALAHGAAYELRRLARQLDERNADAEFRTAIRLEALRILQRKRDRRGAPVSVETLQTLAAALEQQSVGALADELVLAREFARLRKPSPTPVASPSADEPTSEQVTMRGTEL
ncbi:MAG: type III-B CRISPR-associated protein Cas10/Cmr2 [Chloracidobacterium sp.]|nr:type III-B CRISPR-associated protein Cas10/Cmr2 [Chloracidobacterium sp.]MDW8217863.1 type III-B CRISPR-associated protein Cas10/Cmr2 [Acidobacteriota bacterium]